jgi:hypothetical protein
VDGLPQLVAYESARSRILAIHHFQDEPEDPQSLKQAVARFLDAKTRKRLVRNWPYCVTGITVRCFGQPDSNVILDHSIVRRPWWSMAAKRTWQLAVQLLGAGCGS